MIDKGAQLDLNPSRKSFIEHVVRRAPTIEDEGVAFMQSVEELHEVLAFARCVRPDKMSPEISEFTWNSVAMRT